MRRPSANVVAVAVLVAVAAVVLLWQRPWAGDPVAGSGPAAVPADARAVLADQLQALSDASTEQAFADAAGSTPRARTFAQEAWDARRDLGVESVSLRYLSGGDVADRADGSTLATVEVSWRAGDDSPVAGTAVRSSRVGLRLDPQRDGTFAVRSATNVGQDRLPLWLAGDVRVSEGPDDVRVVSVDGGVPDLDALAAATRADRAVRETVADADGRLTVVAPRSRATTAALVGETQDQVAPIAGVTTTVDGTTGTARVIVLNPDLFADMDPRARQVVITHEAAHLLTGAVGTSMVTWVAEGFADYVALRGDDAPLAVSAGQALAQVRADGPPRALPDADTFAAAGGHGLGAVYESAWLVFRMLAQERSNARIVAFYESVRDGADVDAAARRHLGLSVAQITEQWRDYLEKSASTVS
ncbi:MAG: hypothetical protein NTV28_14650 [Propionibacteriales bacterium]|nr:hypothetical protein [Propionibacteriales bacterium]